MTDILLDSTLDLQIIDGDFVIGESTVQNQKLLIFSDKGTFKENPMRGVGTRRYLEDENTDALAREIRQEFSLDGMTVNKIVIKEDSTIEIDAFYK
jgi:hypothetical protein